jgi:hypothetical protein
MSHFNISEEFDLSVYLIEILERDTINIINLFIEAKNKYCETDRENRDLLFNTLTLYINGDLDETHTKKSIKEITQLVNSEENEFIRDFFGEWVRHISVLSPKQKYLLLNKLLSNSEKKEFKYTKLIWSQTEFRKIVEYFPLYNSGCDFVSKGIFQTLFDGDLKSTVFNYKTQNCLDSISDLINDKETHNYLIKYIHKIIQVNEYYTANNLMEMTTQKKCSKLDFCIFILKMLHKIYDVYFDNKDKNEIFKNTNIETLNYKIDNLDLSQQIYITMMYGINVLFEYVYKMYDLFRKHQEKTFIKSIKKLVSESWVQNIFVDFYDLHEKIKNDSNFTCVLHFYDFYLAYQKKDKFSFEIKKEIHCIISNILGGKSENVHTRLLAFNIIKEASSKTGFNVFDNFFENLFKYINEVSFTKLAFPFLKNKIAHQNALTITLLQMTDVVNIVDEKCKYMFPETIYKMISNSFEIFDNFDDALYEKIKINFMEQQYILTCFSGAIEIAIYTLLIYKNLYDRKIINIVYPEIEEKYLMFVSRIIQNIKMAPNNKFQFNQINSHLEKELITICFNIVIQKINDNPDIIIEIKDNILRVIDDINDKILSSNNKTEIKEKLNNLKEDEREYPPDFYDPLTCKIIKNPVMIPNTNEIFDRMSIISQIYNQGINPYTREKLTLEILEKYNQEENVVKLINEFKFMKENWTKEKEKEKEKEK